MTKILTGKKQICNFLGRGWPVIERWILENNFPAKKINGVWESDSDLITEWRRQQIQTDNSLQAKTLSS